ncbi:hypothetical protein PV325_011588, partial [Microctonus aethiopoides]
HTMEYKKYGRISRKHAHQYSLQYRAKLDRWRRATLIHEDVIQNNDSPPVHEDDEDMQVESLPNEQVDDVSDDDTSVDSIQSITSADTDEGIIDGSNDELEEDVTTMENFKKELGHCFLNTNLSHSQ